MKEALFYETRGEDVHCGLCPHHCRIPPNGRGICRVRVNEGGTLYTVNYGRISAMHMDPVEKKPLYHFMPGTCTFSIGSFGCNLACPFCQNHEISMGTPRTAEYSPGQIVRMAKAQGAPSISYTYNEPAIFYEFMLDTARAARDAGLKNIVVSNGYIEREPLDRLLPYIDAMNVDLKTFDDAIYRKVLKGSLNPVLGTIQTAANACHVEVAMLIVPGVSDDLALVEQAAAWLAAVDAGMPLHLSRYFPQYRYDRPPTDLDLLKNAFQICKKHLQNVYLGNV